MTSSGLNVLVITGDTSFKPGHRRFDLQASAVERLEALYWSPGALWPSPKGDFYDVVTAQDPFWRGLLGLFFAHRFKARFNVQVHADLKVQPLYRRFIARFILRRADSVRVVSEALKAQIEELTHGGHPMSTVPIAVLPVFVDVERFELIERKPDTQPTILWIGRFEDEKDPLFALRVFRQVCERGIDAKLIMLGAGSLERRLRVDAAGLPVEFPGWQDPVPYLVRVHVVLSTSREESWGASIIEALAAGVPVVAPDVGVAKEAGAAIVPREKLAEAVANMLRSPQSGKLALPVLTEEEWVKVWRSSLL